MDNVIKFSGGTIKSTELVNIINGFRKREGITSAELQHNSFMAKIRKEIETLKNLGLEGQQNFLQSSYKNAQNKEQPCFSLNRDGMLQMLNSESTYVRYKTIEYINKLEDTVKKQPKQLTAMEQLKLQYQAMLDQDKKINGVANEVSNLKFNMPLFNIECDELQKLVKKVGTNKLGGHGSNAYSNKSLRTKVYADLQHQLKREFGVNSYKAIKRCQLSAAKDIISSYKVPLVLENQIALLNNQISM